MSVITVYKIRGKDVDGKSINIRDQLIQTGALTVDGAERGCLDYDKAGHEDWKQDLENIKTMGVRDCAFKPNDRFEEDGSIKDAAVVSYLNWFSRANNSDRNCTHMFHLKDGIVTRNTYSKSTYMTTTYEFSKDESEKMIQEASAYYKSYKYVEELGCWKRDFLPFELECMPKRYVTFSDDGKEMVYLSNYNASDARPLFYASKALPDAIFEEKSYIEGEPNNHCFCKDGVFSTPTGKQAGAMFVLNNEKVDTNTKSDFANVFINMNKEQKQALIKVNKADVVPSIVQGHTKVCLEEDGQYDVFFLADKTKTKMSSKEICDKYDEAQIAEKRNRFDRTDSNVKSNTEEEFGKEF